MNGSDGWTHSPHTHLPRKGQTPPPSPSWTRKKEGRGQGRTHGRTSRRIGRLAPPVRSMHVAPAGRRSSYISPASPFIPFWLPSYRRCTYAYAFPRLPATHDNNTQVRVGERWRERELHSYGPVLHNLACLPSARCIAHLHLEARAITQRERDATYLSLSSNSYTSSEEQHILILLQKNNFFFFFIFFSIKTSIRKVRLGYVLLHLLVSVNFVL